MFVPSFRIVLDAISDPGYDFDPGVRACSIMYRLQSLRCDVSAVRELVAAAGITQEILRDPTKRTEAINKFNAKAGGVRQIIEGRSAREITPVPTEIVTPSTSKDRAAYLRSVARGECAWTIFGAGRATRMKLPPDFDRLGIAGLTRRILDELPEDESVMPVVDEPMAALIEQAAAGVMETAGDLSIIQRELRQLGYQFANLIESTPEAEVASTDVLKNAVFVVVVNESNREAIARQLTAIRFAGLDAENVYLVEQSEAGGEEILADGTLRWYEAQRWPEGHGDPLIAMAQSSTGVYRLAGEGEMSDLDEPLAKVLNKNGVKNTLFAQVNDLHLMEDIAAVERWKTALDAMGESGSQMVMEMVANEVREKLADGQEVRQKGGATFVDRSGFVTMRDTVAMKIKDLEEYSRPEHISRMFYIIEIDALGRLTEDSLPAYLNERKSSDERAVLTREFYSGDASSKLNGRTMKQEPFGLSTFKTRPRTPTALEAMNRQDKQPGFLVTTSFLSQ